MCFYFFVCLNFYMQTYIVHPSLISSDTEARLSKYLFPFKCGRGQLLSLEGLPDRLFIGEHIPLWLFHCPIFLVTNRNQNTKNQGLNRDTVIGGLSAAWVGSPALILSFGSVS